MLFRNYFLLVLPFFGAGFLAMLPVSIVFAALLLWCFFFFFFLVVEPYLVATGAFFVAAGFAAAGFGAGLFLF